MGRWGFAMERASRPSPAGWSDVTERGSADLVRQVEVGGETIAVRSALRRASSIITTCADGTLSELPAESRSRTATLRVVVEADRRPFETSGWTRLGREAWHRAGMVVAEDVCTSGYDLLFRIEDGVPTFRYRRRPPPRTRLANGALPSRGILLARSALLHYPVMWWAGTRGRAPVHAPAVTTGGTGVLLAGVGGVGKTTLVRTELASAGAATGDNLSVADGTTAWGVVEPMRAEGGSGRAMPHGRREAHVSRRVASLRPDRVVILRRGPARRVAPCQPEDARRTLVASTYAAGELRRFWGFAAILAMGTGLGPAHPPVEAVAATFTRRLPCTSVELPSLAGVALADLLQSEGATLRWT